MSYDFTLFSQNSSDLINPPIFLDDIDDRGSGPVITTDLYTKYILNYARRRLRRNQNVIIIIHGDTGSGKSSASLRIAWDLDPLWRKNPKIASKFFIVYSAFEFLLLVRLLVRASIEGNKDAEIYRGRWIVFEEAGVGASYVMSGIVQELRYIIEIFRQYQINVIFNMPWAKYMKFMKEEYAHLVLWCFRSDQKRRVTWARLRTRYRSEDEVLFLNPQLLEKRIIAPEIPGLLLTIPWAPKEIWDSYQEEKWQFFEETTRRSVQRSVRLAKRSGDLATSLIRPLFRKVLDKDLKKQKSL